MAHMWFHSSEFCSSSFFAGISAYVTCELRHLYLSQRRRKTGEFQIFTIPSQAKKSSCMGKGIVQFPNSSILDNCNSWTVRFFSRLEGIIWLNKQLRSRCVFLVKCRSNFHEAIRNDLCPKKVWKLRVSTILIGHVYAMHIFPGCNWWPNLLNNFA